MGRSKPRRFMVSPRNDGAHPGFVVLDTMAADTIVCVVLNSDHLNWQKARMAAFADCDRREADWQAGRIVDRRAAGPATRKGNTMIIGTMTLAQIRAKSPCRDGWAKLLASLGGCNTPLDTVVSLGDVARSNGAADAWWCARVLDWSDAVTRRAVIGALLLSVRRSAQHTTDERVHACVEAVARWCAGDDTVDLIVAAEWAAWAAREAAWAADAADAAAWAAREAEAVAWAAREAAWAADAEYQQQAADLIAAFPPLH